MHPVRNAIRTASHATGVSSPGSGQHATAAAAKPPMQRPTRAVESSALHEQCSPTLQKNQYITLSLLDRAHQMYCASCTMHNKAPSIPACACSDASYLALSSWMVEKDGIPRRLSTGSLATSSRSTLLAAWRKVAVCTLSRDWRMISLNNV